MKATTKKTFWPWGITIVFSLFVLVMLSVLLISTTLNNDLVTENYYQQEIGYQQHIDQINRTKQLVSKLKFITDDPQTLLLQFPKLGNSISGTILFFRPDDRKKDFKTAIKINSEARQIIYLKNLIKGNWKVKVFWTAARQDYFDETSLIIE